MNGLSQRINQVLGIALLTDLPRNLFRKALTIIVTDAPPLIFGATGSSAMRLSLTQRMKTLDDLFLDELKDIYDAEHRIAKALPKMAKAATDSALKEAFTSHLAETQGQIAKVESVFEVIGEKPKRKTCQATVGLLKEGDEIAEEFGDSPAINAALISAAQKVEHYEMASYGCLREWAQLLGKDDAAKILDSILKEEEAADKKLTEVGRSCSNSEALDGDEGEAKDARSTTSKKPKKK